MKFIRVNMSKILRFIDFMKNVTDAHFDTFWEMSEVRCMRPCGECMQT